MIVVDTQILVYMTTAVPESPLAQAVRDKDRDWAAPGLWRSEFRNVLLGLLRNGRLPPAAALVAYSVANDLVSLTSAEIDTDEILMLGSTSRITAYDLEFVVLARALGAPLVTFDKQVLAAFPDVALHPNDFVAG